MKRRRLRMGLVATFLVAGASYAGAADKAELEGRVSATNGTCPKLTFTLGETKVVTHEATRYEDGTCNDIAAGRKVEVEGKLTRDGTMTAHSIDLD